jgi:hypothetical protein
MQVARAYWLKSGDVTPASILTPLAPVIRAQSEATLNLHFDNLQGRAINLTFDNSTGTPRVQSTNLLTEMRRTEMAQLETNTAPVSLAVCRQRLAATPEHRARFSYQQRALYFVVGFKLGRRHG